MWTRGAASLTWSCCECDSLVSRACPFYEARSEDTAKLQSANAWPVYAWQQLTATEAPPSIELAVNVKCNCKTFLLPYHLRNQ